jgi:hypothetical protein
MVWCRIILVRVNVSTLIHALTASDNSLCLTKPGPLQTGTVSINTQFTTWTESHWWLWCSSFETRLTVNFPMQVVRQCESQSRWLVSLEQVQTPPALTHDDSAVPII